MKLSNINNHKSSVVIFGHPELILSFIIFSSIKTIEFNSNTKLQQYVIIFQYIPHEKIRKINSIIYVIPNEYPMIVVEIRNLFLFADEYRRSQPSSID